ncbi:hypothetical protein [Streptomyces sp. NPDC057939]|uniref:hypothetical protein n=1 Tax=Streptomyces sp. NPDC057939 TaxID=3346284 RepID=UPI0036EC0138
MTSPSASGAGIVTASGLVQVSSHQYYLRGDDFDPVGFTYTNFNGLLAPLTPGAGISTPGSFAVIMTGTELGPVHLTLELHPGPPPPPNLSTWQDIVEASFHLPGDEAWITDGNDSDPLPSLCAYANIDSRIRVHAHGRDLGNDIQIIEDETAVEHHLIQIWPAPVTPPHAWQLTDTYGTTLR